MKSETLESRADAGFEPALDDLARTQAGISPSQPDGLGWLPALAVVNALGLLCIACGFTLSRSGVPWSESLFWIGLIVMFLPVAARLLTTNCSRVERLSLVVVLALALYLVKLLHSPLTFTEHDELLHLRTAIDILQSGHLFTVNPILPVSPLYPAMESVTAALASIAHISIFQAGVLIIACARLVTIVSLFFFIEDLSGSSRVAGIAALGYMANPNFLFFDAMFKYESMALMFASVALFALCRARRLSGPSRYRLIVLSVVMIAATVIAHHLTAYLLAILLVLWAATAFFRRSNERGWKSVGAAALLAIFLNGVWLLLVAGETIGYLSPVLSGAIVAVWSLIQSEITHSALGESSRSLFTSTSGYVAPLWERAIALGSVGLIMLGLGLGVWQVWRWRGQLQAVGVALAIGALAYPASLAFRLTGAGWETANRSSEFSFLPVGFVIAMAIVGSWYYVWPKWRPLIPVSLGLTVIFLGGMIAGWTPQWRMPGPYLPMAQDTRGIDKQSMAASSWTREYLGPHQRIGSDDLNDLVLGSFGDQQVISESFRGQNMKFVLISPRFTNLHTAERKAGLAYLLVDYGTIRAPSTVERYLKPPPSNLTPSQARAYIAGKIRRDLLKFDHALALNRLYDSGRIVIYGVTKSRRAH